MVKDFKYHYSSEIVEMYTFVFLASHIPIYVLAEFLHALPVLAVPALLLD